MMMTDDYTRMPNVYRPNGLIDKQTQGHIKNETFYGENNKPLLSNKQDDHNLFNLSFSRNQSSGLA